MKEGATYKVVIVEDDERIREHLANAVNGHKQLCLQTVAGNIQEARVALANHPRVVLIDLGLPDGCGIDLISEFYDANGKTEFMVITVFGDAGHVIPALEAGATGYLTKETPMHEIAPAIMDLIRGGSPISPAIARKMLVRFQPVSVPGNEMSLTDRESEVLMVLAQGYNHSEAAGMLKISYHTLVSHVKNIYKKLAVNSRSEAIHEATQLGLIRHTFRADTTN